MVTYDTEDENAKMIQRLTSWNTMETEGTMNVDEYLYQVRAKERTVKFDYPPVQSMSEIPRLHPKDIPSLFYSEEELAQLDGDRCSMITREEIEVVAIAPEESLVEEKEEEPDNDSCSEWSDGTNTDGSLTNMLDSLLMDPNNNATSDPSSERRSTKSSDQEQKDHEDGDWNHDGAIIKEGQTSSYNVKIMTRSIDE
eukprot:CAMPEP_0113649330 /NCGR_PEP_ID=MMETSP0017_2-20120614/26208_1 /TAXON_ID=2856 /ORGANISM="Cylindrotheca closterium" /LENGTH=196 /DNA_ID=CAMNT_0000561689 /DNA_START=95 /DNA_END=685 /DNA_ORIENTATION=+ /assembly_acc=CAM_ASM_000147